MQRRRDYRLYDTGWLACLSTGTRVERQSRCSRLRTTWVQDGDISVVCCRTGTGSIGFGKEVGCARYGCTHDICTALDTLEVKVHRALCHNARATGYFDDSRDRFLFVSGLDVQVQVHIDRGTRTLGDSMSNRDCGSRLEQVGDTDGCIQCRTGVLQRQVFLETSSDTSFSEIPGCAGR